MVGTTSDEWNPFGFFMNPDDIPTTDAETVALLDEIMGDGAAHARLYREVRGPLGALDLFNAVVGDWRWWAPNLRFAEALADRQPVFFYEFAWKSPTHGGRLGAGHCVDLPFTFHNLHTPSTPYLIGDDAPVALADAMHDAWIAFVKTGDPSTEALGGWPRYDTGRRATMTFASVNRVVEDPRPALRAHWLGAE
jgi:para-nitrobenzyl esterase